MTFVPNSSELASDKNWTISSLMNLAVGQAQEIVCFSLKTAYWFQTHVNDCSTNQALKSLLLEAGFAVRNSQSVRG